MKISLQFLTDGYYYHSTQISMNVFKILISVIGSLLPATTLLGASNAAVIVVLKEMVMKTIVVVCFTYSIHGTALYTINVNLDVFTM